MVEKLFGNPADPKRLVIAVVLCILFVVFVASLLYGRNYSWTASEMRFDISVSTLRVIFREEFGIDFDFDESSRTEIYSKLSQEVKLVDWSIVDSIVIQDINRLMLVLEETYLEIKR